MDLAALAGALIGHMTNDGPKPEVRPQGPGLNRGEAPVRQAHGLPTRAKKTQYSSQRRDKTISRGTGVPAKAAKPRVNTKPLEKGFKGIVDGLSGPAESHGNDFDFGRMDSMTNWKNEWPEIKSNFSNANSDMARFQSDLGGPGDWLVKAIQGVDDMRNEDYFDYDQDEGVDFNWEGFGRTAGKAAFASPARGAMKPAEQIYKSYLGLGKHKPAPTMLVDDAHSAYPVN